MNVNCRNCDSTFPLEYFTCPYCAEALERLRERLEKNENGVADIAQVTGWVNFGFEPRRERLWRVG